MVSSTIMRSSYTHSLRMSSSCNKITVTISSANLSIKQTVFLPAYHFWPFLGWRGKSRSQLFLYKVASVCSHSLLIMRGFYRPVWFQSIDHECSPEKRSEVPLNLHIFYLNSSHFDPQGPHWHHFSKQRGPSSVCNAQSLPAINLF